MPGSRISVIPFRSNAAAQARCIELFDRGDSTCPVTPEGYMVIFIWGDVLMDGLSCCVCPGMLVPPALQSNLDSYLFPGGRFFLLCNTRLADPFADRHKGQWTYHGLADLLQEDVIDLLADAFFVHLQDAKHLVGIKGNI